jgi:CheY-like chemotaxis protein
MSKRILVVSDDRALGFSRVALLKKAGYLVDSIDSDDAAMALLEAESFDLILLGRNSLRTGRGLDQRLRERHPDLLTLKIEANAAIPSIHASRVTDARPERVLAVLAEMLGPARPDSAAAPEQCNRGYKDPLQEARFQLDSIPYQYLLGLVKTPRKGYK